MCVCVYLTTWKKACVVSKSLRLRHPHEKLYRYLCNAVSSEPVKEQSVPREGLTKAFIGFWNFDFGKIMSKEYRLMWPFELIVHLSHLDDALIKPMLLFTPRRHPLIESPEEVMLTEIFSLFRLNWIAYSKNSYFFLFLKDKINLAFGNLIKKKLNFRPDTIPVSLSHALFAVLSPQVL